MDTRALPIVSKDSDLVFPTVTLSRAAVQHHAALAPRRQSICSSRFQSVVQTIFRSDLFQTERHFELAHLYLEEPVQPEIHVIVFPRVVLVRFPEGAAHIAFDFVVEPAALDGGPLHDGGSGSTERIAHV